jgi:hypothetical protein
MKNCPSDESFTVCERVNVSGQNGYTYIRGQSQPMVQATGHHVERHQVQTMGKDTASILFNLEFKLRELQAKGIPYSTVNRYFRAVLKDEQYGMFDLKQSLTYERNDPQKTYQDAYTALTLIPSTLDMSWLYAIVEGIPK